MQHRVLIIEDSQRAPGASPDSAIERLLLSAPLACERFSWTPTARNLPPHPGALVIIAGLGEPSWALAVLDWLRRQPLTIPLLAVIPAKPDEELLRAVCETADDFVFWPASEAELRQRVGRMLGAPRADIQSICDRLAAGLGIAQLIGRDPSFAAAVEKIPRIAAYDTPVLITGETGAGKELCAHAIHHLSKRSHFPFVPVECGAIPDLLAENELFGHARGAYTDAHRDQRGLAAMAEGGTLFLDEVDALSLSAQAKLLRFIQDGSYRSLGADRFTRSNVRIFAATNRDLQALVRQKEFRADLYFRLDVLQLRLPPLRERRGDIPLLAHHFLDSFAAAEGTARKSLSPGAVRVLTQYDWPGNVRELRNVVQRAAVFSAGAQILPGDLALPLAPASPACPWASFREARRLTIEQFERVFVEDALRCHGGNITRAALACSQDRRAFGRLVKKYGVSARAFGPPPPGGA